MASASSSSLASSGSTLASGYEAGAVAQGAASSASVTAGIAAALVATLAASQPASVQAAPPAAAGVALAAVQAVATAASVTAAQGGGAAALPALAQGAPAALSANPPSATAQGLVDAVVAPATPAFLSISPAEGVASRVAPTVSPVRRLPRDWLVRDHAAVCRLDAKAVPERVALYFDCAGELSEAERIASVATLDVSAHSGTDPAPGDLIDSTPIADAGGALVFVARGLSGVDYRIDCTLTTDAGRVLLRRAVLPVRG